MKTIIFDFDGVIVDSFNNFYTLIRDAMSSIGKNLSPEQYRNFFKGNVHKSFTEFIDNEEDYRKFMEFRKNNLNKYYRPKLYPGISNILKDLKNNYKLTIASSGNTETILRILKENEINDLFDLVFATTDSTKENIIREILQKTKTPSDKAVLISDTAGDVKAAKKIGLKTIAVTWGFHSIKQLGPANPTFIVDDFRQIKPRLTQLKN